MSKPARILIVDDEPNIRLMFRTTLAADGYLIATAEDGDKALMLLQTSPFDLVLLDLQMPRLNGMRLLERLRESCNDVPVVIITAHGSIPDAVAAVRLGAIDFLQKPIAPAELRRIVSDVLSRDAFAAVDSDRPAEAAEPATSAARFSSKLKRAKRALNRRLYGEAASLLTEAIALDPNSAEAHNLLGVIHELRQEHDDSYREYRAALQADRHYDPARQNIRRYYERYSFGRSDVPIDTGGV
jgi:DNA-binding response OmpR family regulator